MGGAFWREVEPYRGAVVTYGPGPVIAQRDRPESGFARGFVKAKRAARGQTR